MNKLKELGNTYFWMIVAVWVVGICIAIYLFSAWQEGATNRAVTSQTNQANNAVKQAQNAANVAANFDIERRAEDAVRETVLKPRLDESRRKSQTSKAELDAAKRRHQENAKTPKNFNSSVSDNCAELARLYPDVEFQYCH